MKFIIILLILSKKSTILSMIMVSMCIKLRVLCWTTETKFNFAFITCHTVTRSFIFFTKKIKTFRTDAQFILICKFLKSLIYCKTVRRIARFIMPFFKAIVSVTNILFAVQTANSGIIFLLIFKFWLTMGTSY